MRKARISVSIPADILKNLTRYAIKRGSQIVLMHDYIINNKWVEKKGRAAGVVLLTYHHDVRGINAAITAVQHSYGNIINASLHYASVPGNNSSG